MENEEKITVEEVTEVVEETTTVEDLIKQGLKNL